jgi:hypothetical protein
VGFAGLPVNGIDDLHRLLTGERIGGESELALLRGPRRLDVRLIPTER